MVKDIGDLGDHQRLLQSRGLKNTKHRTAILEVLERSDHPITAEEVYLQLRENGIAISLSTVYRAFEVLTDKGVLMKSNLTTEIKSLFEINRREHKHYLLCLGCHKLFPVDDCPLEEYEATVAKRLDFKIKGHQLEIYGYCRECQPSI